ncbi:hypothetical protein pb186bvf_005531 [Paramecium bursaria]
MQQELKYLTQEQLEHFYSQGFIVLPDLISHEEIENVKKRTDELIQDADIINNQIYFHAKEDKRGISFLETAESIGFLLEDDSIDENGNLRYPEKKTALNKIGHAMHDVDPVFEKLSYKKEFGQILRDLGYQDPKMIQSMLIFKNPKVGTKVDMHTDNIYIISQPKLTCLGMWLAMDDATNENGCMWAFPGSHQNPTKYFSYLTEDKKSTVYEGEKPDYSILTNPVCLEAKKGTIIILHGDLVHYSSHNHSQNQRNAFTWHFIDGELHPRAWIQRKKIPYRNYYQRVQELIV